MWTPEMTSHVVSLFPNASASQVLENLVVGQQQCQRLFSPQCWISGDPNPTNWGINENGAAVLYDWERFGRGTPAIDLAITIPGLGDQVAFQRVATRYLQNCDTANPDGIKAGQLARDIAMAKVWNIVEFTDFLYEGKVADTTGTAQLIQALPGWLHEVQTLI
jgi:hypothetical protein